MKGNRTDRAEHNDSATLKDVATASKVSISTASRVLSQVAGFAVKEETRQRIMTVAHELNYRHNSMAKTLRSKRSHFIGLFLQDMESGMVPALLDGLKIAAGELEYQVVIHWARDGIELQKTACDWLAERRIDGIVFSAVMIPEERLQKMDAQNLPYVLMTHSNATSRYTTVDDSACFQAIVEHLHNLGHRNIAYISGSFAVGPFAWRLECFKQALAAFDLPFRQELAVGGGFGSCNDGVDSLHRLLRGNMPFTAVVGATSSLAIGALSAAHKCRLRIPSDLSLVALHDVPLNSLTHTPLTAVRMPVQEVCRAAIQFLDDSLNDRPVQSVVVPGAELIVRGSTGGRRR